MSLQLSIRASLVGCGGAQVVEESQAALAWLKEKQELQARLGAHEDPVLVSGDIKKKEDTLRRVADPILSQKPPPPPKVGPHPCSQNGLCVYRFPGDACALTLGM